MSARDQSSKYDPNTLAEIDRLSLQGTFHAEFDKILFQAALGKLPLSAAAVDLGCGWGDVTMDRFGAYSQIEYMFGYDRNQACIQAAQDRYGNATRRFRVLDIESEHGMDQIISELRNYSRRPALVFMSYVLMHLKNPTLLLSRLFSLLPKGSVIIARSGDDSTMVSYPDPQNHLEKIIQLTTEANGSSDRFHGRKMYLQFRQAGFHKIQNFIHPYILPDLSSEMREIFYQVYFTHRFNSWEKMARAYPDNTLYQQKFAAVAESIEAYRQYFQDPNFYYSATSMAVVAEVS